MAGKICAGDSNVHLPRDSRAFCEGRAARAAEVSPTNPYVANSPEADAWDLGVASKVSNPNDHYCCAATGAAAV